MYDALGIGLAKPIKSLCLILIQMYCPTQRKIGKKLPKKYFQKFLKRVL
tara:strand:+ start:475 stop:621 length:147 start_codon:yes stop_codon:yes gene_type:complete